MNHWPTQHPLPWKNERGPWALKQHPSAHKSPPATSTAASKTNAVGHHCQPCFKGLTRNDCMSLPPPGRWASLYFNLSLSVCLSLFAVKPRQEITPIQPRTQTPLTRTHAHTHALNINISSALDSSEIYSAAKPAENWLVSWRQAIDTLPLGELGRDAKKEREGVRVRTCPYVWKRRKESERERERDGLPSITG